MSDTRLIEVAFPLKQTSLDSVHAKNVRHGHISTLHIWPARRPLAASRAALIATLLKDPKDAEIRRLMLSKLGGKLVKDETDTEGGILHWGRESSPDLQWFRDRIRETYGGRAPRMLDPFAGGGAIPLEAMRLGCEVTAADINPVAWFLLKCTLEYPQRMAGKELPLPAFALQSVDFMTEYLLAKGLKKASVKSKLSQLGVLQLSHVLDGEKQDIAAVQLLGKVADDKLLHADLAWHVRAWGRWVLERARKDLEHLYPVVDNKPTVAYLWARTVMCKNCRATVPLLKTRWLCKKDKKRVVLTMQPNSDRTGVVFGVQEDVEVGTGNTAQKREHDKRLGGGTMSRSGAQCPCCKDEIMRMEEIRDEGQAGRLGMMMTSVVIEGKNSKEYRLPTTEEIEAAQAATQEVDKVFAEIPFGLPQENIPKGGNGASRAFSVDGYGLDKWYKLFTARQLVALGTFVKHTRAVREAMKEWGYEQEWIEAISAYLALALDRLADYSSSVCSWHNSKEQMRNTFGRFALPIVWDFTEVMSNSETSGGYYGAVEWIGRFISHELSFVSHSLPPHILRESATKNIADNSFDIILTDPPYYDAIPYSDLMDFFYVWLRRTLYGLSDEIDQVFHNPLSPKWDHDKNDGELIDDSSRFQGNKHASKQNYEDGMARAFQACYRSLAPDGRLVIVFAHKQPDAWETLVSSIIRAGFVVDGSWPIQTEMGNRTRALSSAALSSSVWLVCKKRARTVQPGWDQSVLAEMREKIHDQLRNFWDAGIRGPDFVWAATGPAMEAYSKYPVVMKADQSDSKRLEVRDFLQEVRRMVLDFVVGRVLTRDGDETAARGLDEVTTYYLLHRHDFQMESVPVGPCILYAVSCGLEDVDLTDRYDILARSGGQAEDEDEEVVEGDAESEGSRESEEGTKSKVRLKVWSQRKRPEMGYNAPQGRTIPIIDQIHRLLHLWAAKDQAKVDTYVADHGLGQYALFAQVLQAIIELAPEGSEERALLESISNHIGGYSSKEKQQQIHQPDLFV